jgi:uncharacterized protein
LPVVFGQARCLSHGETLWADSGQTYLENRSGTFAADIISASCPSSGRNLREDFGPESDIDFLVEFDPAHIPGLLDVAGMEIELSELLGGRRVDLRTAEDLSRYFRDEVVAAAEEQYAEG